MAYARRQRLGASRTFAIAIVALTQASLGYAIVNGLAYTAIQKAPDGLKTFNVEQLQPPPPERRPEPKKVQVSRRAVAPPPLVRMMTAPPRIAAIVQQGFQPEVAPAAPPASPAPVYPAQTAPAPPAVATVPPRSAMGDLQKLFSAKDYPVTALARREKGSVTVQLTVGVQGRVGACDVTSSSGSSTLDKASCQILLHRAIFTPARDSSGNLTTDTVRQEIIWALR